MKKKFVSMIMAVVLCGVFAAGCGSSGETSGKVPAPENGTAPGSEAAEAIESTGTDTADQTEAVSGDDYEGALLGVTLKVGTDTSFVPFCFPDDNNVYTGFDIELLEAMSEYLGFEYELSPMDFTALLMSVQTNKLDMGLAGITITDERKEVMDFADPYYDAGLQILVQDDNEDIKQIADLKGKKVALKEGTASVDYVNENVEDCTVTTFPNIETAYMEVQRGVADAVVYDSPNMLYYTNQNPDSGCKVVGDLVDGCQYGIVLQKSSEYTEYINAALAKFHEDGTYDAIYEKWFGQQ